MANPSTGRTTQRSSISKLRSRPVIFVVTFAAVGLALLLPSFAATTNSIADFSKVLPNKSLYGTHYLNGANYAHGGQSWAVLWFGDAKQDGSYKMYNSNPADSNGTCHWDQFRWTNQQLLYSRTRNLCGTNTDIRYSPALMYLPKKWNGANWSKTGNSIAKYYERGVLKCSGVNHWTTTIVAKPVELSRGVLATHMQSTQTTKWMSGPGSSATGCKAGEISRYQESLYFVTDLPIYGSQNTAPGLKRSVGGSLDFYAQKGWDWDIWFNNWKPLP